ncbi:MAG TPA: hypothetical protein VFS30_16235 [Dehalococcoidia bacterium]|nr:hypothetical protein [Dehalococcoidia bacterium]
MTRDLEYHAEAERWAAEAESFLRAGESESARRAYAQAARNEILAADLTSSERPRTKGILSISAASLSYKAGLLSEAETFALKSIALADLPEFALEDLKQLLQVIWEAKSLALSQRRLGDEEIQVAIRGSDIGVGRAPMGLVLDKVVGVRSLLYRVTELLAGYPLRTRGVPAEEIRQICQPWVSEPQAGSFKFTIRLTQPLQPELIPSRSVVPAQIGQALLSIIRTVSPTTAAGTNSVTLEDAIPNQDYQEPILKLLRNIVPDGHRVREIEFMGAGGLLAGGALLHAGARFKIEDSLSLFAVGDGSEELRGVLRAVDLDRTWLEVAVGQDRVRCRMGTQVLDDVIGPMLNRRVIARASRRTKRGTMILTDIELDPEANSEADGP